MHYSKTKSHFSLTTNKTIAHIQNHRKLTAAVVLIFVGLKAGAQQEEFWATIQTNFRVSNRWGIAADINHRWRKGGLWRTDLSAVRAGAVYFSKNNRQYTTGYAWFGTHTSNDMAPLLQEHRLYQQILLPAVGNKMQYAHRIRLEERFQEALRGNMRLRSFSVRLRYMFSVGVPLLRYAESKMPALLWIAGNELMLQAGENIGTHYFNQNRLITGAEWRMASGHSLALLYQYTNRYSLMTEAIDNTHVIRFTGSIHLDGRK